jgi:hypothetical protein
MKPLSVCVADGGFYLSTTRGGIKDENWATAKK